MLSIQIALFVGGFIHLTLRVCVHALHFLFPTALWEALQVIYFRVTKLLVSSGTITDLRTVCVDCGNRSDFCISALDVRYVQE